MTSTSSLDLENDLGDLGPGQTLEIVSLMAVAARGAGRVGGEMTAVSLDDPSVTARGDVCWTVNASADPPPENLQVTKTLLTQESRDKPPELRGWIPSRSTRQ